MNQHGQGRPASALTKPSASALHKELDLSSRICGVEAVLHLNGNKTQGVVPAEESDWVDSAKSPYFEY